MPKEICIKPHFVTYKDSEIAKITEKVSMRRPMSAYMWYAVERLLKDKKSKPALKMSDMAKVYGADWKSLAQGKKKPYEEKAAGDKKRYESDLLIVKSILAQDYDNDGASAYRLFVNDKIRKAVMEGGEVDEKEIKKQAREEWDEMDKNQKRPWNQLKRQNDEFWQNATSSRGINAYALFCKKQIDAAREKDEEIDYIKCKRMWEKMSKNEKEQLEDEVNSIKMERKRANELRQAVLGVKPTRPAGAFAQYLSDKSKGGDKANLKERYDEWKKLSSEEKKPYEEKYRQAKLVYLYKKKLYNEGRRTRSPRLHAKNAFMFFAESLKGRTLPDGYENFGQYIKGKWDKLDSKQKEKFEKMAEEDRAKVERKNEKSHPENRIYDKPKRPQNAFNIFIAENKKENETIAEATKRLGSDWEDLKQKEREKYEKKATKEFQHYHKKVEMFKEKGYFIDKELTKEQEKIREKRSEKAKANFHASPKKKTTSASKSKNKK